MRLDRIAFFLGLILTLGTPSGALAQCNGQFGSGQICGNPEASTGLPKATAPFLAVKRHSSAETTYTIAPADCGHRLVATNNTNAMTWTLPSSTGSFALCTNLTVTNVGVAPLFINNATTSLFNPWAAVASGTLAGPQGFNQLTVSQSQTVTISSDGNSNWLADVFSPSKANGYEKSLYTTSYSLSNGGPFFVISGTPTIGNVIGFDYIYETTPGGPGTNTLQFRYTFTTNTVAELETAAQSLITQMKNNATLVSITGPDQAQYFVAVQEAPLPNPIWLVAMNQVYPFNPNNHPHVTVVNTPPGHTVTIVQSNDNGGGTAKSTADIGSWFGCTRGTIYAGRQPQVGDRICGFFVGGEVTGYPVNNHDYQPIYGSFQWTITDPTPGVAAAQLVATAQSYLFSAQTGGGLGGFQINTNQFLVSTNSTGTGGVALPTGTAAAFIGADGGLGAVTVRGFGGPASLVTQTANGTGGTPTAVGAGNNIAALSFGGYNGASAYTQSALLAAVAAETYTGAHSGSYFNFYTTPIGTNTLTNAMRLQGSGALSVGNIFDAGAAGRITAVSNTAASFSLFAGTRFYSAAVDGTATTSMVESFGASGSVLAGRSSGGTGAAPTATPANTSLVTMNGYGFTTALTTTPNGAVAIVADSLWSVTNAATHIAFLVTPTGSTTPAEQMRLGQSGGLSVGATTDPGNGVINALIGYRVANAATSGSVLRGNGTNFVSAVLAAGDISGLGTAATQNTGTSGATIPLLNGTNTWSNAQTFSTSVISPIHAGGAAANSTLTLESTTGAGTTDAIIFATASQSERARILTGGNFGIGTNNPQSHMHINNNVTQNATPAAGVTAQITGADASQNFLQLDAFGASGVAFSGALFSHAAGTAASKTQTQSGTTIGFLGSRGYTSTAIFTGTTAQFQFVADEAFTGSAFGTRVDLYTTPDGSTTTALAARFNASGGLGIGTTSDPGIGLIYTNSASFMIRTKTSYTNGAGVGAGTITTAPSAGNPTKWIPIDDNGTTRYIPAW